MRFGGDKIYWGATVQGVQPAGPLDLASVTRLQIWLASLLAWPTSPISLLPTSYVICDRSFVLLPPRSAVKRDGMLVHLPDVMRVLLQHGVIVRTLAAAQARPARLPDPIAKPDWLQQKKLKDKVIRRGMTGAEMAVRAANKAERELNAESRRAAESQGGTTITLAMRPNAVITELADGWLEVPQALSPRVSTPAVPEVAEEVGVPKVLEGSGS
jgi:hypothetical protein